MRLSAVALSMMITTVALSACEQRASVAMVEDRGGQFYGRMDVPAITVAAAPVEHAENIVASPINSDAPKPFVAASSRWQWPVEGQVISPYGPQPSGTINEGITISAAEGDPIRAALPGEVAFVGQDVRDYGNMVILRHEDGTLSSYSHARSIIVAKGDKIADGALLGYVGRSGGAKAAQLHFAVREGDHTIDPMTKLPHDMASN